MQRRAVTVLAAFLGLVYGASAARAQCGGPASHAGHGDSAAIEGHQEAPAYRSPGLAAGLSLTPVPVDFGNLYAGNIGWGIASTSLELGLMAPMFFIAANHGMGHYGTAIRGPPPASPPRLSRRPAAGWRSLRSTSRVDSN